MLRLHAFVPASRANGPGLRAVVWFQGCTIGCPGCFNPDTHSSAAGVGESVEPDGVWERIRAAAGSAGGIEGVSFSGGEPFQQPDALLDLVERSVDANLSVVIFSGYTRCAIEAMPLGAAILGRTDVLIAGPYRREEHAGIGLLGSANQRIHFLTGRYSPADFAAVPTAEVVLHRDGTVTLSGIKPLRAAWPARRE